MDSWLLGSPIRFGEAIQQQKKEGDPGVILSGLHQFSNSLPLGKGTFTKFSFSAPVFRKSKESLTGEPRLRLLLQLGQDIY